MYEVGRMKSAQVIGKYYQNDFKKFNSRIQLLIENESTYNKYPYFIIISLRAGGRAAKGETIRSRKFTLNHGVADSAEVAEISKRTQVGIETSVYLFVHNKEQLNNLILPPDNIEYVCVIYARLREQQEHRIYI